MRSLLRLKRLYDEAAQERATLAAIMGSMSDGLLVLIPDQNLGLFVSTNATGGARVSDAVARAFADHMARVLSKRGRSYRALPKRRARNSMN